MKRIWIALVVLALLLIVPAAFAQDTPGVDVTPPETALEQIINAIFQFTYVSAGTAALITTLVGIVKIFVPRVNAALVNLGLSILLWAAYWIANQAGQIPLYDSLIEGFNVILVGLLGAGGSSLGASWLYKLSRDAKLPVLGYKPPEPVQRRL